MKCETVKIIFDILLSKDKRHIVFGFSLCLSAKLLTLAIFREWLYSDKAFVFYNVFFVTRPFYWDPNVLPCDFENYFHLRNLLCTEAIAFCIS
jgi:hypothetical protein